MTGGAGMGMSAQGPAMAGMTGSVAGRTGAAKALAFVIAVFAATAAAKWAMEAFNVLEVWDPGSAEWVRSSLGNEAHSLLKRINRASAVLAVWTILDALWLPWLKIEAVARGFGEWKTASPAVRAAIVGGWFVALSAFLLSFSLGI